MASCTPNQKTVDVAEAIEEIERLKETPVEYGRNIVSSILRMIAAEHGYEFANEIADRHELDYYFSIPKQCPVKKAS